MPSSNEQIQAALASRLETELGGTANPKIPNLQVSDLHVESPTPPTIDMYPGSPFVESIGFGPGNKEEFFTIRARVLGDDHEGQQRLLLSMMDPFGPNSVEQALWEDPELGGVATIRGVEGPTEFGLFRDPGATSGSLLGCTWRVRVVP